MLSYYPPGVQPNLIALYNGALWNDDGHGYAIAVPNQKRMIVRRSLDFSSLSERFAKDRKRYPDGPALFHSRLATHGLKDKSNCHPFYVGNDRRTVVAHNGILPQVVQPMEGDPRSDTRIFAETMLPYRNIDRSKSRRRLERWLMGDRLVVLTVNPRWLRHAYMFNTHFGSWDEDVWYSNDDYQGVRYSYAYGNYGGYAKALTPFTKKNGVLATRRPDECMSCQSYGTVSEVTLICTACLTCNDCGWHINDGCLCYVPTRLDRDTPAALEGVEVNGTTVGTYHDYDCQCKECSDPIFAEHLDSRSIRRQIEPS